MTDIFSRRDGELHIESIPLSEIAERFGTPAYVYSRAGIEQNWRQWVVPDRQHMICYAVKANSNLAILAVLAKLGAGFDIVSEGELRRVLAAGGNPRNIVFSGVGKNAMELELALDTGIKSIHIESTAELQQLAKLAQKLGKTASVAMRVRPEIETDTHQHIATGHADSKFGMTAAEAIKAMHYAAEHEWLQPIGLSCHIGSQIIAMEPFIQATDFISTMLRQLQDIPLQYVDMGGGIGIRYRDETPPAIPELTTAISSRLPQGLELLLEPGRSITGSAGVLLTKVEYIKHSANKNFAIVDAGMNDFMRPALYRAWHRIESLHYEPGDNDLGYDIVGPVCESGDCFGSDRKLNIKAGDLLAILDTGAYGATMACEYNSRPRPCELLLDNGTIYKIRARGSIQTMLQQEHIPEHLLQ